MISSLWSPRLAADVVVVVGDSGARPSWPRPIPGAENVSRVLLALAEQISGLGIAVQPAEVKRPAGSRVP